ncbi:hypothetical protein [Streptomyces lydicus]|uniref:hypothetical protein n=1 Tax=Streptomyces lydicus TaxID=47763 RepID=UPI0037ADEE5A
MLAALTVDRVGRRRILALFLGGAAAVLTVLAVLGAGTAGQVLVWTSLAAVCFFGANICLYLSGLPGVFALLGGVALLGAPASAAFGEETAGRTLEELSP